MLTKRKRQKKEKEKKQPIYKTPHKVVDVNQKKKDKKGKKRRNRWKEGTC